MKKKLLTLFVFFTMMSFAGAQETTFRESKVPRKTMEVSLENVRQQEATAQNDALKRDDIFQKNRRQGRADNILSKKAKPIFKSTSSTEGLTDEIYAHSESDNHYKGRLGTPSMMTPFPISYPNNVQCGEYINGVLYIADYNEESSANLFGKINTTTGDFTQIGTSFIDAWGMAWNPTTNITYASTWGDTNSGPLYMVDITTGAVTLVGDMGRNATIAIDNDGICYAIRPGSPSTFGTVDLGTGAFTQISTIPFTASYVQNLSVDRTDNELYWAARERQNITNSTGLYKINKETGDLTLIGTFEPDFFCGAYVILTDYANNPNAPAAPTNLTTVADPTGLLSCVLNWTNPSLTVSGNALTKISRLIIKRNNVIVHTITSPTVGATETWTDNSPVTGNNTYVIQAFNNAGDGDAISKTVLVGTDATIVTIQKPENGSNLTSASAVEVTVKNLGVAPITSLPIKLEVNGAVVATETITAFIPSLTEHDYTFTATVDLSAVQTHSIKAYVELPDDGNITNDTILKSVINYGNLVVMGSVSSVTSCNVRFVDDGVDQDYSATTGDQMITFFPATAGEKIKVTFNELNTTIDPIIGDAGYYDALFVFNGAFTNIDDVTDENVLGGFTGDFTGEIPDPIVSESENGALTFYFTKKNMFGEPSSGWDADISCFAPLAKNAGITAILSPSDATGAAVTVKVMVKNYGVDPITAINLAYVLDDNSPVIHSYTGNITKYQSAEITFDTPINLTSYGNYNLKVYTDLTGDMDHSNDTMKTTFAYLAPIELHAYRVIDLNRSDLGFVSFTSDNPGVLTLDKAYTDGTNNVRGGEYLNSELYIYTAVEEPIEPRNFIKMTNEWNIVSSTTTTGIPNDVTYDHSTKTMFAVAGTDLYTINLHTGRFKTITSSLADNILTLACRLDGKLYGVSTSGDFYSINKTNGDLTLIGKTGFVPNFLQSMAFDHNTGRLFWAFLKGSSAADAASYLLEIDPATGKAANLGNLGGVITELLALYIPYDDGGNGIDNVGSEKHGLRVYPNPVTNGKLIVEGNMQETGSRSVIRLYDLAGNTAGAFTATGNSTTIDISHLPAGTYILKVNEKAAKIVKN